MSPQEFGVDGLAPAKPLVGAVPEMDSGFAQLPAQAHVPILKAGQEIDESDVQILDQRAGRFDLLQSVGERGGTGIPAGAQREMLVWIDVRASRDPNSVRDALQLVLSLLRFGLVKQRV